MKFEDYKFEKEYDDAHLSKVHLPEENTHMILNWKDRDSGVFLFSGNPGVGKTYLAAALVKAWIESREIPRYMHEKTLFSHLRQTMNQNFDYDAEIRRLCDSKYFILDDLGSSRSGDTNHASMTDWQKEVLLTFLDIRSASMKPTLITTNFGMKEINDVLGSRFVSRLRGRNNRVMELIWKDKR